MAGTSPAMTVDLFPGDERDEFREAFELLLDEIARRLIGQFTLVVDLVLHRADENLRPIEDKRVEEHHRLTQMILHARAAKRAHRGGLDRDRLACEGLVRKARDP